MQSRFAIGAAIVALMMGGSAPRLQAAPEAASGRGAGVNFPISCSHAAQVRFNDALAGLHRISPATRFLGSYQRADGHRTSVAPHTSDQAFRAAHAWVKDILGGASAEAGYTPGASPRA